MPCVADQLSVDLLIRITIKLGGSSGNAAAAQQKTDAEHRAQHRLDVSGLAVTTPRFAT